MDEGGKFCIHCGAPAGGNGEGESKPVDPYQTVVKESSAYGVVNLEQLPEGHLIDERYEVKSKLGQGGFGAVYRVFDRKMECEKALKVLPEAVASDRAAMVSLKKEAVTMAKLNHPGIVHVYDFCDSGSIKYIDMEFVEGTSLSDALLDAPEGRFDEGHVTRLARQLAEGLAYAHTQGVIHKDIKAQNILISASGDPKITDFGISETVKSSMSRIANSSSSGTLVYMAPEQIRGRDVGRESDIYSFGALLYELLSGHPPFYKGAIEHQILSEPVPPLEGVSESLGRLVLRCLEKEYTDRYRSFDEVLAALDGNEVPQKNTPGVTPEPQVKRSGKPMWMVAAAVLVLAVAAGVYGLVGGGGAPDETASTDVAPASITKDISQLPFPEQQDLKIVACREEIDRLANAVTSMKTRMDSGQPEEGDSMKAMLNLIQEKAAKTNALGVLVQEKEGWQRKQLVKDIDTYKGLVATEEGKSLQAVAWKELIGKYPAEAEGVVAHDTDALLDGCRLYVDTEPEGATVKITNIGPVFFPGMKLKPGRYDISVKSGSYLPKVLPVDLTPGGEMRVTVRLSRFASLNVETQPTNARVILKGIKETYSPGVQLKPGTYRVLVKADEHTPLEREVVLKAGEAKEVSFDLVPWPELVVTTTPKHARVEVKGVMTTTYAPGMRLKPGRYTVVARAEDYKSASALVTLKEGKKDLHLSLEKNNDDCLFPMKGITLGVTTAKELAEIGVQCKSIDKDTGKPYLYYTVDGTDFWYDKDTGLVDYLPFSKSDPFTEGLKQLGFDHAKSYNEWKTVLKKSGFEVTVVKKPTTGSYKGRKWLRAELKGTKTTSCGIKLRVKCDFSYGKGLSVYDKDTLNSVYIWGDKA